MKEPRKIEGRPADLPALGTKEAAMRGCVDLIARMCGKPEHVVRYWLDLYFQTRLAYAVEEEQRRIDKRLYLDTEKLDRALTALRQSIDAGLGTEQAADHQGVPVPEAEPDGEAAAEAKAEEAPVAEGSVTPPPTDQPSELAGFEPVTVKRDGAPRGNAGDAARYKREILARLLRMRRDGLTIAKIVNVANGSIKEETVLDILAAKRVPIAVYRLLAEVLDQIES